MMTSGRLVPAAVVIVFIVAVAGAIKLWQSATEGPQTLRLSTGTSGGTYAAFGEAFANSRGNADGVRIEVVPSAGAGENARRIAGGTAELGLIQSDTPVLPDTPVIARLFPEAFHLVARTDAGIRKVTDLEGKRVGLLPEGAGSNALFARLLAHYEMTPADLAIVHAHLPGLEAAIGAGEIDAFFMVVALGNETMARIIKSTETRLVPIDQAEAMAMFDPALSAASVPVGAYSGQRPVPAEPTAVVTVQSLLAVRRDLPDATVEALTRGLFESRQEMVRELPQAAFVSAPTEEDRLAFGVHPGADLYYSQDDPFFVVEYAEPLALGVTALALVLSGLWQARVWLAGARKNRADHYNLEIVDIIARIDAATSNADLEAIRQDLFEIFRKVIVDLDHDRIEEKSLLSFSFAWQAAASTLNHRQQLLGGGSAGAASAAPAGPDPALPDPARSP